MVVVLQAKLIGVLFQRHAHCPRRQRFVGVVLTPHGIDGVEIDGGDGAVGLQSDVPLRAQEQENIVRLLFGLHTVVLCAGAFSEAVVVGD